MNGAWDGGLSAAHRILMCAPAQYDVRYRINPWMRLEGGDSIRDAALAQWQKLRAVLAARATVELVEAVAGVPDMVFTANAGFVLGAKVVPSRFRHAERRGEEAPFRQWFEANAFDIVELPDDLPFEGAGDALIDRALPVVWMGHGFRTDAGVAARLQRLLDVHVQPLRLVDPRFYHLDTCLCPLEHGELMYYPGAFDEQSRASIESLVPRSMRIPVSGRDALAFACNAVSLGGAVVLNRASRALAAELGARGYIVSPVPLTEFMKAGGSAKCLTLRLDEGLAPARRAAA